MQAFARVLAVALVAVAAACGGDGINDPLQSAAGTYTLRTFNGAPPPVVIFQETGVKVEITAASYVLTGSGTFTNSAIVRQTINGTVSTSTETLSGSYTMSGTAITFTDSDGDVISGVLSGNDLQFSEDGMTAVFSK